MTCSCLSIILTLFFLFSFVSTSFRFTQHSKHCSFLYSHRRHSVSLVKHWLQLKLHFHSSRVCICSCLQLIAFTELNSWLSSLFLSPSLLPYKWRDTWALSQWQQNRQPCTVRNDVSRQLLVHVALSLFLSLSLPLSRSLLPLPFTSFSSCSNSRLNVNPISLDTAAAVAAAAVAAAAVECQVLREASSNRSTKAETSDEKKRKEKTCTKKKQQQQ